MKFKTHDRTSTALAHIQYEKNKNNNNNPEKREIAKALGNTFDPTTSLQIMHTKIKKTLNPHR